MNIAIVDDDLSDSMRLRSFIRTWFGAEESLDVVPNITSYQSGEEMLIIFLTTSKEYAFDTFLLHPFDYIIKPCTKKNVSKVLAEAVRFLDAQDPKIRLRVPHSDYAV